MKNHQIITLAGAGVSVSTNHTLSPAHGYKAFRFRKAVAEAMSKIQSEEAELLNECGINDPASFDARLVELRSMERDEAQEMELKEMTEKLSSFLAMRASLYDTDVELHGVIPMPYDEWFKLQNENREKDFNGKMVDIFSGAVEDMLEGVLWVAPEE